MLQAMFSGNDRFVSREQPKVPARDQVKSWQILIALLPAVLIPSASPAGAAQQIVLRKNSTELRCIPATLKLDFKPTGKPVVRLSVGLPESGEVLDMRQSETEASWRLKTPPVSVTLAIESDGARIHFTTQQPCKLAWPRINPGISAKGWILPLHEGAYAPVDDARWAAHLVERSPLDTTADLGLPFIGLDLGDATLTSILTNPFNNSVAFENQDNHLSARVIHEFTPDQEVKEFGVRFVFGKASPIEPARAYRAWLQSRGEFVSLDEKMRHTPGVEKLFGAAHIYLWGDALLTSDDVTDWKTFLNRLSPKAETVANDPANHIRSLMTSEARKLIDTLAKTEWPDRYSRSQITDELNRLLLRADFYNAAAWRGIGVSDSLKMLLRKDADELSEAELCRRNCGLLAAAFPDSLADPTNWGGGISVKMIKKIADAGLDRLRLGAPGWEGLVRRPEIVEAAREADYLIGPYDSYHSIHHPDESDTWPTAQFDRALYETGAIIGSDGKPRRGFKGKGYLLSPAIARPHVERRVSGLMKQFNANSWFIDCDAFGQYYDDYSPAHPATQQSDLAARLSRMSWIRDTFGAVIGSEGCSASAASTIHFAHGVMTPVIGWGDPDLKDKQSPFYPGAYYPPSGPAVFFKPTRLKDEYFYRHFDPRFRLPLFQTVFHDSVIATHQWGYGSLKFIESAKTTALLELLYNVPPLYHLNPDEFQKRKQHILAHYEFFSPLHRELAMKPLTGFAWLTSDRLVQRTEFGGKVELIANFSGKEFVCDGKTIPAGSILARWLDDGKTRLFTPQELKL